MLNTNLNSAKTAKKDEFYTQLADVKKELDHYHAYFSDKAIYCNCDNPAYSNFWRYFAANFIGLGLKKLIATYYAANGTAYKTELTRTVDGDGQITAEVVKTALTANGDFRSPECIKLLKEADIVVTNPPFSLFKDYIVQLNAYAKQFIVLGNTNAITYREIFPLLRTNQVWLGYHTGSMEFQVPGTYPLLSKLGRTDADGTKYLTMPSVTWYTNIVGSKQTEELTLTKHYSPEEFPTYDNFKAINVNKVANIPMDYPGVMGVPITFMTKYSPDQFEILGCSYSHGRPQGWDESIKMAVTVNGKGVYKRLLIRHK